MLYSTLIGVKHGTWRSLDEFEEINQVITGIQHVIRQVRASKDCFAIGHDFFYSQQCF